MVDELHSEYGNSAQAAVFIQSFEVANLQYLNGRTDINLVQLIDANDVTPVPVPPALPLLFSTLGRLFAWGRCRPHKTDACES